MLSCWSWIILFLATPALAAESWYALASQKTYEIWRQQECQDSPETAQEILEGRVCVNCQNRSASPVPQAQDFYDVEEKSFFNYQASKQEEILQCQIKKLQALSGDSAAAIRFQHNQVAKIANKLEDLRSLSQSIQESSDRIGSLERSLAKIAPQGAVEEINQLQKEMVADEYNLRKQLENIWALSEPEMASYIDAAIASDLSPDQFQQLAKEKKGPRGASKYWRDNFSFKDLLKKMSARARANLKKLQDQSHTDENGHVTYDLVQGSKEFFTKQALVQNVRNDPDVKGFKGLICRLDARYGRGPDYFENSLVAGSFALGGLGMLAKVTAIGRTGILISGEIYGVRAAANINAANTLLAGSSLAGTGLTLEYIHQNCFGSTPKDLQFSNCESADDATLIKITEQEAEQQSCVLSILLAAEPLASAMGLRMSSLPKFNK